MGYFGYKAVDVSGKVTKGSLEAASLEEAAKKLREQRLYPVKIEPSQRTSRRSVPDDLIIAFCKDLGELLSSGLPMDRSLALLVAQQNHRVFKRIVQEILNNVQEGKSLSDAVEKQEDVFGSMIHHMVRAGEASGALEAVLNQLGYYLQRRREFKQSLISASIYPSLLLAMSLISMLVLIIYVIPKFAKIFEDLHQGVPFATRVLLKIGQMVEHYGWLIPIVMLAVFVIFRKIHLSSEGKKQVDRFFMKLPVIKTLIVYTDLAKFFISLGTMVKAGVPLLRAILLGRNVIGNHVIKQELYPLYDSVKAGKSVSSIFSSIKLLPPRIPTILRLGEEKGELGEALLSLGTYFEEETEKILKRLITFMEPAVIIGTGFIIGIMVLSMFSAILGISDIRF